MSIVVNVKVENLRKGCPCCGKKFRTLKSWLKDPQHVYVGRRNVYVEGTFDSEFKNPYRITKDRTREDVVEKFRRDVENSPEFVRKIEEELEGKTLGCWCAPMLCHANVLEEIANNKKKKD